MTIWEREVRLAEEELRRFLRALPAELRRRAESIEVIFEKRPSRALVDEGFDPDLMGLFEGPSIADPEGEGSTLPPRILLFLDSIWDEAEHEERAYREEVRTTLLHELGHYLGLGEDDLAARDLE